MATVFHQLLPEETQFLTSTFADLIKNNGTNYPILCLAYDAGLDEAAFWKFRAINYGSGDLTLDIDWYADTASSGVVRWGYSMAVITPNTDTQNIETDSLTTEEIFDDTHLGTTGQRLHRATIAISNLDSLVADDYVTIRIRRVGSNAADTMAGDAFLTLATLSYSDT